MRAAVLSHPTLTLRALLNDTYLFATSSSGVIEAWPCTPTPKVGFKVQAQNQSCTEEIPVNFSYRNSSYSGFLDPLTMIIFHFGTPADCSRRKYQSLHIFNKVYVYTRGAGTLKRAHSVQPLKLLSFTSTDDFNQILPMQVLEPVILYSWREMTPNSSLSALWHSFHLQTQVFKFLSAGFTQHTGDHTLAAGQVSRNLVSHALSSIIFVLSQPFYLWLFLTCALINCIALYKLVKYLRKHPKVQQWFPHGWRPFRSGPSKHRKSAPAPSILDISAPDALPEAVECYLVHRLNLYHRSSDDMAPMSKYVVLKIVLSP